MMRGLVWWIIVLVAVANHAHGRRLNLRGMKTIEKRQICSNNNCNSNVCDGRNCNSCNSNSCCSSINCNTCVNQCANNCNTPSCTNNCVSGCSTACQRSNCDTSSCSQCVSRCNNQCSNSNCVNDCARNCDCTTKETNNDSVILVPSGEGSKVIVNNTNNNLVNLTTHININNVVHNFNNISIPVFVNTTNINNINLSETSESHSGNGSSVIRVPYPVPYPVVQPQPSQTENCCYVLHPRQCYTDDNGGRRCTQRRSRECSNACTSPVVSIEEGQNSGGGCQRVNSWPYNYCGNYVRRDCNQCYTCGGTYNPSECFSQSECSENCRRAAPSCVPSQYGLQCS